MLVSSKRSGPPRILLVLILVGILSLYTLSTLTSKPLDRVRQWVNNSYTPQSKQDEDHTIDFPHDLPIPPISDEPFITSPSQTPQPTFSISKTHHEIFSNTTPSGAYFPITFGSYPAINPNIIPNPTLPSSYVIIAQHHDPAHISGPNNWLTELYCAATFSASGTLSCTSEPLTLPIAATSSAHCAAHIAYLSLNIGPHDARVAWGPNRPFIIYGSNSQHGCFGQWMQDFRMLAPWTETPELLLPFRFPTDLPRPGARGEIEKNWFAFWDVGGELLLHYDVWPARVFARVEADGSVGSDLGEAVRERDAVCMKRFLPALPDGGHESVHQATNSLAVTMCRREDPLCTNTTENTFVVAVVHHKKHYHLHSVYEPIVVLFRQTEPFELYAIGEKPIWIHGRKEPNERSDIAGDQSEMIYVTSMNWKDSGRRYHGFLDDVIMLGFGIEDQTTGGMDVTAGDLLGQLGLCDR